MNFKVGDRVVLNPLSRENNGANPGGLSYDTVYIVTGVQERLQPQEIYVRPEGGTARTGQGSFYASRFKLAPPAAEPRAMTIEVAREQRAKLAAALGKPEKEFRIRSRSWDTEGLYFAIEIGPNRFYKPSSVEDYLGALPLTDVAGTRERAGYFIFKVNGTTLLAPDKSKYWTLAEIRECGGIVTHQGRRYRLGEEKGFVPFV